MTFSKIKRAVGIAALATSTLAMAKSKPTNIVVFMSDDIGLGDIGYYHQQRTGKTPVVPTPNIDNLIKNGMQFTDAHSPASLCAPTRFSMLTGNYSYRNKAGEWGVWSPYSDAGILGNFTTTAQIAKAKGYNTAFFGKWGLGGIWDEKPTKPSDLATTTNLPFKIGFDYSVVLPQGIQNEPFMYIENGKWMKIAENSAIIKLPLDHLGYDIEGGAEDKQGFGDSNWYPKIAGPMLISKATKYIEDHAKDQKPIFVYYCSQAVHVPHAPTDRMNDTDIAGTTPGKHGDMIKELDAQVGLFTKTLKEQGLYDNTLFIFTSDNGGLNHDEKMKKAGHDSSNGLREKKGSIYEGGHRVPFIAVWPGKIKAGTTSAVTVTGLDMVATIASITKTPIDRSKVFDSANLLPVFLKNSTKPLRKYMMHQSQAGGGPYYALREGNLKLVMTTKKREDFGSLKVIGLYDLSTNLNENPELNLVDKPEYKAQIEAMKQKFLELRTTQASTLK